ncbi:MAG: leucyl aminopeptidase [Alphaproteobacteria bacterium]|nr:leucyl aminopeptidase [Alphaproteobacteria bacterium]
MSQELLLTTAELAAAPEGVTILFCGPELALGQTATAHWSRTGQALDRLAAAIRFAGKPGQLLELIAPAGLDVDRLWISGAPAGSDGAAPPLAARREQGGALMARIMASRTEKVVIVCDGADHTPEAVAELAAGLKLKHYRFDRYKTRRKPEDDAAEPDTLAITLVVADPKATDKAMKRALAVAEGVVFARDLVNTPPNILGPEELADAATDLAGLGVDVDILDHARMEKLGMGALLAVARGSARPARMAVLSWNGGKTGEAPLALVGKGVVFDTGGISIKPAASMEDMKGDMGGAAAVLGTIKALALRKAKANVVGICGFVENMPDGNAYRPGDIVTSMSGQTIEIVNTDAEGRLVLADALWYAQDRFKPSAVIDLATLTGAILVALGQDHAGLFSNDDALAGRLAEAGAASGDKLWRLPMGPAYDKLIESRFADMKNSGGRFGGSISAAQFLKRFITDTPWAHLDIAGTAFGSPAGEINSSWGTGFGVALLDRLVRDHYEG